MVTVFGRVRLSMPMLEASLIMQAGGTERQQGAPPNTTARSAVVLPVSRYPSRRPSPFSRGPAIGRFANSQDRAGTLPRLVPPSLGDDSLYPRPYDHGHQHLGSLHSNDGRRHRLTFQTPITIVEALRRIQRQDLVLPAIQRSFVWGEDQIVKLFDSILRGYPIGSFLSWQVEPDTAAQFRFYGFMREYHQKDNPHCPKLDLPRQRTVAVLDGQQRLTALNIGLRGSYASRLKYGRRNRAQSYPVRRLYLNVLRDAGENDQGMKYDFRMLAEPVTQPDDGSAYWFPVSRLFEIEKLGALMAEVAKHSIGNNDHASGLLGDLFDQIHNQPSLYFYEETDQEIDKVLDIFIRVNSGGTKLSHSDLLLSIATAQWDDRDARQDIQSLVDNLNGTGQGFAFSKDVVLKSGLVLTGHSDVGFKVRNFTRDTMVILQKEWDSIGRSLQTAAGLLADFGLSEATLTADSVLIPIAYYIHRRELNDSYRTLPSAKDDRAKVRSWVIRSLLKTGVWGSGLDTLLSALREVIDKHGAEGFPLNELESRMAARGKGLTFTQEEIEELLGCSYGWADTFVVLALLFPHINTRNLHHVDHVFPRAQLTPSKIKKGLPDEDDRALAEWYRDRLPNLQLLEGPENVAKKDQNPLAWAQTAFTGSAYDSYLQLNALPDLPSSILDFPQWCEKRYKLLEKLLAHLLGVDLTPAAEDDGEG